ncbi:MAG TPA: glycosyltransferase family 2 protein, partial [Gemmatimonadaceae bacterium]|nr:glycosyltransferase family 2 protein [Gemmatimonadaceae bacterium]
MSAKPFISVIIPTHNRSALLRQTVDTFLAQDYPADSWELLLVDNGSTDGTWDVITKLTLRDDRVRGIREMRKGAHFARNSGAVAAKGEILYFTDDDMLADPRLLSSIIQGFEADPKVASVTGKVLPRWDTEPPMWVLEHCRNALLSLNDLGESLIVSDDDPGVFSCHQAVKREAFMRAGGFNPDTNAGVFTGDNETGLNIKIRQLGFRFAYVGTAVTHHMIPASRMTQSYLNSRMADQGFCDSYTDYRAVHPGKMRLARRIVAHSVLGGLTLLKAAAHKASGDSRWRLDLARIFYHRNRMRYDARLLRDDKWRKFALRDDWIDDTPVE